MAAGDLNIEARIQRLEDTEHIRTLKSHYHTYVNDTDFDRVGSLFAAEEFNRQRLVEQRNLGM